MDTPPPPRPAPVSSGIRAHLLFHFVPESQRSCTRESGQLLLSELNLEDPHPDQDRDQDQDQDQEEEDVPGRGARGRRLCVFGRDEVHVGYQRPQTAAGNAYQ